MDGTGSSWTLVRVVAGSGEGAIDLAGDQLWMTGAAAIEEQDGPKGPLLVAGYPSSPAAEAAVAALRRNGFADVEVRPVTDDGLDSWRPWARTVRAGRFHLVPAWVEPPTAQEGELVVSIDPGPTFGSGSHASTQLCAAALDLLDVAGLRVLDVGCGSGVLSVLTALAGAEIVVAIDIDGDAPAVTRANAIRNGVGDRIRASTRSLSEVVRADEPFDVVAANLLAPVFDEVHDDLVGSVRPGGHLVAGGLLADRWKPTVERLAPLAVVETSEQDGWVTLTLRAPMRPT